MDFFEAFAHTWGSTGTVDDSLTTTQYDQGWNFIGSRPPRLGEFNKREKLIDQRLKWLYDQIKTAADAHGVMLNGSDVGGLLAILQDLIGDHASASDPHGQYQLESGMSAYATLASPNLTGVPTAPTAAAGTNTEQLATTAFAMTAAANSAIAGSVQFFAMSSAPTGWLKANGAQVSRTAYASLFTAIGTTFGAGNGSTTFTLPDLRGEFVRGWDDGRGLDVGRTFGSAQGDELRAHSHNIKYGSTQNTSNQAPSQLSTTAGVRHDTPTDSFGGTETRPRNIALLPCIKY